MKKKKSAAKTSVPDLKEIVSITFKPTTTNSIGFMDDSVDVYNKCELLLDYHEKADDNPIIQPNLA